jgi:hypothetical protein
LTALTTLRIVAAVDAANVTALLAISPRHGAAAAAGYAPALLGTVLVHASPNARRAARVLCCLGLIPNTILAIAASGPSARSRRLSAYVATGGALLGVFYLHALRPRHPR